MPLKHTHTHTRIHTTPCMFQHLGWTLYPLIVQTEDKTDATPHTPPAAKSPFSGSWWRQGRTKTGKTKSKATFSHSHKSKVINALALFYPLNMHSGEVSPGSSDILCFYTTYTPDFLSLKSRDRGPGRASLSQGLPSLDLHTCVL